MAEGQIFFPSGSMGGTARRNETFILLVKFYSKVQSLPGLTLPPSNDDCDSVARNGFTLGVFIELVAEILCVNVAGTLSGVA